jgi:chromosome segregation ATPase
MSIEPEIQAEIESLKVGFAETKALYREVCALLFFRYGITPTASKLYQYVRKGSMSAPADALARFWEELRSKARVQIDHPDLPDALKLAAAETVHVLWTQATEHARVELAALRIEAQAEVQAANDDRARESKRAEAAVARAEALRSELEANAARLLDIGIELDAERRSHTATAARAQELQRQVGELQAQLERARADFGAELDKGRQAIETANERAAAAQRHALLEIEQDRQARGKVEKQLDALRVQLADKESAHRVQSMEQSALAARLQTELAGAKAVAREQASAAERHASSLNSLQEQLAAALRETVQHKAEADTLRSLVAQFRPPKVDRVKKVKAG